MEKDFVKELGLLSVVTRLKRLSDAMIHDGRKLYKQLGMDIEPNWFVIFKLLSQKGEMTITEIAEQIGFAHPSVISIANKMIKEGYLEEKKCGIDSRRRLLKLTPKSFEKIPAFELVWDAGVSGIKKMLTDLDILFFLDEMENRIGQKGFRERALAELNQQKQIEVIEFTEKYSTDFARLNYEWIEQYFKIENHDREMLDNPIQYIINTGGQIFFALRNQEVLGTVALINESGDSFELAKMAVSTQFRGLKIGDKLMEYCLNYAKNSRKRRVYLLSNRKLIPALNLYKKFGFQEVPLDPNNLYERTDIQMELIFK